MNTAVNPGFGPKDKSGVVTAPQPAMPLAVFLRGPELSDSEQNLITLLDFFGVPWRPADPYRLNAESESLENESGRRLCVISSAIHLAEAMRGIDSSGGSLPAWFGNVSSVFVHDFQPTEPCIGLLSLLTGAALDDSRHLTGPEAHLSVTEGFPELCGPLSGLRAAVVPNEHDRVFTRARENSTLLGIVSASEGISFLSVVKDGVRFFLSASSAIININSSVSRFFDVRKHFCSAVPITMYLRWAFPEVFWSGPDTLGCLILDDPLLKSRYGFFQLHEAVELMDRHNFTMALAFIPWNYRRTSRQAVQTFKSRPDILSVCFHGCDHTASEFAARSIPLLNKRVALAIQRMETLSQRTSLRHEPVMVFPQGAFSAEAARVLKRKGFLAIANTETVPSGNAPNSTTVADLWRVAIMKYGTFPIFTRRYVTHGIENFAFDALLGKPCLLVAHHDGFKDQARALVEFIDKLNSLNWSLRWRPLEQILQRSFKGRTCANGKAVIEMFSTRLILDNQTSELQEAMLVKEESEPDAVRSIIVNEKPVDYIYEHNCLLLTIKIMPGARVDVRILYEDLPVLDHGKDALRYRLTTALRRHLSEFRDNYMSRNKVLSASATGVKRLLRPSAKREFKA